MPRSRLTAVAALTLFAGPPQVHDSRVELVRLADGVYAAIRREPLGLAVNSNSLIVVGRGQVLVVDAQFTREATHETIAAIRSVTPHPVRWVVNTHWHDDHVAGNQVYRDSFPGVQFVLHQNTREDLARLGEPNRTATGQGAPPLVERYDRLLVQGLGVDSTPVSENERASLTSALRIMRRYLAELPDFRFTAEGPTVQEGLRLEVGEQVVDIRWFGRANTRGDLVVSLPRHGIVATGDLVVRPIPFGFLSYPREWTAALDSVAALRPRLLVPGHGPVMRDLEYLRRVRSLLAEAADSATASHARGDSLAAVLRTIDLERSRREMTGGEKWLTYMWNQFFLRPVVTQATRQLEAFRGGLEGGVLAITNASVIPMTADTLLLGATVLIRAGRIAAVGRDVAIPPGASRLDARGRYLIPGLADMHTHLYADDEQVPDSAARHELGVMLANGVTAARLMIGTPQHLALRREIAAGRLPGPQLWVASPQLTGRASSHAFVAATPEEARAAVGAVADSGYDFVKLTLFITPPVYDAVVDEARKRGIRVVGHVDPAVGVPRALAAGQQIEHLDSYFEAVLADSAPMRESVTQQLVFRPGNWASLDHIDEAKIDRIAGETARARVWSSPTLNIFNRAFADRETDEAIRSRPDWSLMPPRVRALYLRGRERYWSSANVTQRTEARQRKYVQVRNRLVKAIHDSGGRILAGSDTPEWFHAYGWGLHRELEAFVAAGLTARQALATATVNPAEFLNQSTEWGVIAPGRRADLILLDANPLTDIRNTQRIEAVIVGGRVLRRPALEQLIAAGSAALDGGAPPDPR